LLWIHDTRQQQAPQQDVSVGATGAAASESGACVILPDRGGKSERSGDGLSNANNVCDASVNGCGFCLEQCQPFRKVVDKFVCPPCDGGDGFCYEAGCGTSDPDCTPKCVIGETPCTIFDDCGGACSAEPGQTGVCLQCGDERRCRLVELCLEAPLDGICTHNFTAECSDPDCTGICVSEPAPEPTCRLVELCSSEPTRSDDICTHVTTAECSTDPDCTGICVSEPAPEPGKCPVNDGSLCIILECGSLQFNCEKGVSSCVDCS